MRKFFLAAALIVSVSFLSAEHSKAYVVNTTDSGTEISWDTTLVGYQINPSGGPSGSIAAIQASMQAWSDVSTSSFTFAYDGQTTSSDHGFLDFTNVITFGEISDPSVLAENAYWYLTTGEMIDSDIMFNTNQPWDTTGTSDAYDVQNVGTHELGHSLSLGHVGGPSGTEKTMYPYASLGETKKRTLDQDDIDGITFLYPSSTSPVSVTVATSPSGRQVTVDGNTYTSPQTFNWTPGASHTIGTTSPQSEATGTQYVFSSWSDGGSQTHTVAPSSSSTYTATFTTQYLLTTGVDPPGGGSVSPNCIGGCWYTSGQSVELTASAASGFSFSNWSGSVTGTANPTSATMSSPRSATANFTESPIPGSLSVSPSGGLSSSGLQGGPFSPASQSYTLSNPGGSPIGWTASKTQPWVTLSNTGGTLAAGASATVTVSINSGANSLAAGLYSDTVSFTNTSNGNGNSNQSVNLTIPPDVESDTDRDGVPDNEEKGPNGLDGNYDGNVDGTPDWQQNTVASLLAYDMIHYVTLESQHPMTDVQAINPPSDAPSDVSLPYGLFTFTVSGVPTGGDTIVKMFVDGDMPDVFYKYGRTPLMATAHWYNFAYDSTTGIGATVDGFVVTLRLTDGEMGDDDLVANGTIVDDGGPGVTISNPPPPAPPPATSGGGGGGGGCTMTGISGDAIPIDILGSYGLILLLLLARRIHGSRKNRRNTGRRFSRES